MCQRAIKIVEQRLASVKASQEARRIGLKRKGRGGYPSNLAPVVYELNALLDELKGECDERKQRE